MGCPGASWKSSARSEARWSATYRWDIHPAASIERYCRSWRAKPICRSKTYSIRVRAAAESLYNELPYARRFAELFGTEHHEIVVKPASSASLPLACSGTHGREADCRQRFPHDLVSGLRVATSPWILSGVGGMSFSEATGAIWATITSNV